MKKKTKNNLLIVLIVIMSLIGVFAYLGTLDEQGVIDISSSIEMTKFYIERIVLELKGIVF